jgi:hypothetical protein
VRAIASATYCAHLAGGEIIVRSAEAPVTVDYSHFYKTQLRPTLKRIDLYVTRWARRKFKRLR